jgi:hypothetical protein
MNVWAFGYGGHQPVGERRGAIEATIAAVS